MDSYPSISAILPEAVGRSIDFQNGVVAGWNACAVDQAAFKNGKEVTAWATGEYTPDFYAGFLAGYRAFMEKAYDRAANGGPEKPGL